MPSKPTILLIDDEKSLLDMYTLKFSLDGACLLLTAETPEQGLELADMAKPDLILLDLVMAKKDSLAPELNEEVGFETLKQLKTNKKTEGIPVVIFTNLDEVNHDYAERAKKLGATGYWVKAKYQPGEVVEKVKKLVQEKETARA